MRDGFVFLNVVVLRSHLNHIYVIIRLSHWRLDLSIIRVSGIGYCVKLLERSMPQCLMTMIMLKGRTTSLSTFSLYSVYFRMAVMQAGPLDMCHA